MHLIKIRKNKTTLKTEFFYHYLCNLGIAWAAVLRTYGDISEAESRMASITIGTMTLTLMLDKTLKALARISWFGS